MRFGIDLGGTKIEILALGERGENGFDAGFPLRATNTKTPSAPFAIWFKTPKPSSAAAAA